MSHLAEISSDYQANIERKNGLIYFRQFDQRDIINRLVDYLADAGVLL